MSQPSVYERFEQQVGPSQEAKAAGHAGRLPRAFGWRVLVATLRSLLRLGTRAPAEDRRVLEQVILQHYGGSAEFSSLLLVGCAWHTRHYQRTYFPQHDYWTLEPCEPARRYGARRHVIAPPGRLEQFFPEDYFDAIVCHDAHGVGLETPEKCELAFTQCHSRLREGGHLVVGWDDVPARCALDLEHLPSLQRFGHLEFPGLGTWRYPTATRYRRTYDFYLKEKELSARATGASER